MFSHELWVPPLSVAQMSRPTRVLVPVSVYSHSVALPCWQAREIADSPLQSVSLLCYYVPNTTWNDMFQCLKS